MTSPAITIYDDLTTWTGTTEATGWKQPGNVGDTGGPNPARTPGTFTFTPGEVGTFSAKPAYPYNNGYWYVKWREPQTATLFLYDFWVRFPAATDLAACQALEFELQQSVSGHVYNMAWQVDANSAAPWRYFDKINRKWVTSAVANDPAIWAGGQWVRLAAAYLRQPDHALTHVALRINRSVSPVEVTQPAQAAAGLDYLSAGFQLDCNKSVTPYKVEVQRMRVTAV